MYNLTGFTNATTPAGVFVYANDLLDKTLFTSFLVALWFIFFIILKKYSFEKAFASSSFLCFIISLLFSYGGFVAFYPVVVFATMTIFAGFWLYLSGDY
jgi:hypothetical protein